MDPTGNFYNYRTALRGAAHRSLTAHSNREKVGVATSHFSPNGWCVCGCWESVAQRLDANALLPSVGHQCKARALLNAIGNVNLQLKGV